MYLRDKLPEATPVVAPVDGVGLQLLKAAQIIRERGWCQRVGREADGRVCALGAIAEATRHTIVEVIMCSPVAARLRKHISGRTISDWNDEPGRTAGDVIAALETAAFLPSPRVAPAANHRAT